MRPEFWVFMCVRCPYEERATLASGIAPPYDSCPACGGFVPGHRYGHPGEMGGIKGDHELVHAGYARRPRARLA